MLELNKQVVLADAFITMHIMAYEGMLNTKVMQDTILELEREILTMPQVEMPVKHMFAPGIYIREMTAKAGTLATGAIHKTHNTSIIVKGDFLLLTDKGIASRVKAPYMFTTDIGIKRVAFFIEDTTWITIHPTTETDIDKLKAELTAKTFEEAGEYLCP